MPKQLYARWIRCTKNLNQTVRDEELKLDFHVNNVEFNPNVIIVGKKLEIGTININKEKCSISATALAAETHKDTEWKVSQVSARSTGPKIGKNEFRITVKPDGRQIALAPVGNTSIELYAADNGTNNGSITGPTDPASKGKRLMKLRDIRYLTNNCIAVLEESSNVIRMFSQNDYIGQFKTVKEEKVEVRLQCIAVDQNKHMILVGDKLRKLITFHDYSDLPNVGPPFQQLQLNVQPLHMDVSKTGLIAVCDERQVSVLSRTGKVLRVISTPRRSPWPRSVCFTAGSRTLLVAEHQYIGIVTIEEFGITNGIHIGPVKVENADRNLRGLCQIVHISNDMYGVTNTDGFVIFSHHDAVL